MILACGLASNLGRILGPDQDFTVRSVMRYSKSALPAANVFDQDVTGGLAIVSCAGLDPPLVRYQDNVVAYASRDDG